MKNYATKQIPIVSLVENPRTQTENLRKELRAAFPDVKFSIRYKTFSGGDEIRVSYIDGPKSDAVKAIASRYTYDSSGSNIMTDYYDYQPTEFTQKYGGAKFVFIDREMSEETRKQYIAKAIELLPELANGNNVCRDDLFKPGCICRSVELFEASRGLYWVNAESLARNMFNAVDIRPKDTKPAKATSMEPTATEGLQLVDYSEKAIAVIGDTKAIKDKLKELGGRFNPRLSCGAGWIFSKRKETELRALFAL